VKIILWGIRVFCNFSDVISEVKKYGRATISVAAAQDKDVLQAVKAAYDEGIADAILVGDEAVIRNMANEVGLHGDIRIINEPDIKQAALAAVSLVRSGEAQLLLKGIINTADYMKAILNAEVGLRTGRVLSHLTCYEVPGADKLMFFTDGGINISPTLEEKKDILDNSIEVMKTMGISSPKIAVLTANEQVSPKMPATVDAKALADMYAEDTSFTGIVEGPVSMDVALSAEAAKHKGISSRIAGDVDLFLFPSIEAANITSKSLIHFAGFRIAWFILGATNPVLMVSRSYSAEAKLHSIALGCLALGRGNK
jgi:phosphate butyryltransferase